MDAVRIALLGEGADLAGDLDRLFAQLRRLSMTPLRHQRLPESRQHLCSFGSRRIGRYEPYSGLVFRDRSMSAGGVEITAELGVQQTGAHGKYGLVDNGQSCPSQGDRTIWIAGEIGRFRGVLQYCGVIELQLIIRIGHLIPQFECSLEVPPGIGESVRRLGLQPGLHCSRQRPCRLMSPDPVIGQSGRRSAAVGIAKVWAFGEYPSKRRV